MHPRRSVGSGVAGSAVAAPEPGAGSAESGEELLSIDEQIAQQAPEHERDAWAYADAVAVHEEAVAMFTWPSKSTG